MIFCMLLVPSPVAAQTITRVVRATDGDTGEIRGTQCRPGDIDAADSRELSTQAFAGHWGRGAQTP